MKKLLIIASCMLAVMAAQAQGTLNFANNSSSLVKYGTTADVPTALQGTSVPINSGFNVAMYWLNGATFQKVSNVAAISPVAGRFNGQNIAIAEVPLGGSGTFQVRVWSGGATYSSWEAAMASGDPSIYAGESANLSITLGGGGSPPASPTVLSGVAGFSGTGIGNVRPVPEPSIVALGLLGAAALLIRRRN